MINVTYNNEGIKIEVGEVSRCNDLLPFKVKIKKHVSGETQWETNLQNYWFATYPNTEMFDVEISDVRGNIIYKKKWDVFDHGNIFYKALFLYNKKLLSNGVLPKGLVVGTHDGEFGEWVPVALRREAKMYLVEASDVQYEKLNKNYKNNSLVKTFKKLITPKGGQVEFFEGGQGYTNSVDENVIRNWETEEIKSTKKDSTSINEFIQNECGGKLDWIHMDVEGLDAKLILAIKSELLPSFIIFEDYNLKSEEKENLFEYLKNEGFTLHSEKGIAFASR